MDERERWAWKLIEDAVRGWRGQLPKEGGGCEVCQLCGRLDRWSSVHGAMAFHFSLEDERSQFTCGECWRSVGSAGMRGTGPHLMAVKQALEEREHAHCEICTAAVARVAENREDRFWLCPPCRERLSAKACAVALPDVLRTFVCSRYWRGTEPTRPRVAWPWTKPER